MKKLKLSGFDLGIIIAFAVLTLLGGGAWWYLSSGLQTATDDVHNAYADFNKASIKSDYTVSSGNGETLKSNIEMLKSQLDPLIQNKLQPKDNKLESISKEVPVAWKHDLEDEVSRLRAAAKVHNVDLPPEFYFGFSRYKSQNPGDDQTAVLNKQLLAVDQLSNVLINASVKNIQAIRRTYEEDSLGGSGPTRSSADPDRAAGLSISGPGNDYTAYLFEVEFVTTSENLRPIISNLLRSPYIFVVRSLSVVNSNPSSPLLTDLDRIAQTQQPSSMTSTSPGEVAATTSTLGPQFLFGNETITVKMRVDMIEWTAKASE